jgi:hypothetical protein
MWIHAIFLTVNGLLVASTEQGEGTSPRFKSNRPEYIWSFHSNSGKFYRIVSRDEAIYLASFLASIYQREAYGKDCSFNIKFEDPVKWTYMFTQKVDDYSNWKFETSNNGGDYSFHENIHFYQREITGRKEYMKISLHSTSAEFSYDEVSQNFTNSNELGIVTLIDTSNKLEVYTVTKQDEYGYNLYYEDCTLSQMGTKVSYDEVLEASKYDIEITQEGEEIKKMTPERELIDTSIRKNSFKHKMKKK